MNNKQTWRVMATANSTKIKKSSKHNVDCCVLIHRPPSLFISLVCQHLVCWPSLLALFVVLVVVRCPCCCPLSSLSFVLVVVPHPPRLRRVESHSSQHSVDCCVSTHRPPSSFVVLSLPLLSTPLLSEVPILIAS